MIYVNGNVSELKNIFDLVFDNAIFSNNEKLGVIIGRNVDDVLSEWIESKTTFYYLNNEKINFSRN